MASRSGERSGEVAAEGLSGGPVKEALTMCENLAREVPDTQTDPCSARGALCTSI